MSLRPRSLVLFDRLFWLARIAGATPSIWQHVQGYLTRKTEPGLDALGIAIYYLLVFSPLIPPVLLWFFVSRKASRIAKWLLFAFVAYEIVALIANGLDPAPGMVPFLLAFLIVVLLDTAALIVLNRRDARAWFKRKALFGGIDPETFA